MVKIYAPSQNPNTNTQHSQIIKWLEQNPQMKDAYVFLEFDIPGGRKRNVDVAVLLEDRICVIELKGHEFVEIPQNGAWQYKDTQTGRKMPLIKKVRGKDETPYQQAVNTADNFKAYILNLIKTLKKLNLPISIREFLLSEDFKVYPAVFISKTRGLEKVEEDKWCYFGRKKEGINQAFIRKWKSNTIDYTLIEKIATKLNLIPISSIIRKGSENKTLIQIMEYMLENQTRWNNEEQIKTEMFASGKGRPDVIRKALNRGIQEVLLEKDENGIYKVSGIVRKFVENGYSVQATYAIWKDLRELDILRIKDPKAFQIYTEYLQTYRKNGKTNVPLNFHRHEIPKSLRIFDFSEGIQYQREQSPELFRSSGVLWADINADHVIPFISEGNSNLSNTIFNKVTNGGNCLLIGNPFTGKTTLARSVGIKCLDQAISVLYLQPDEMDDEAYQALKQYEFQEESKEEDPLPILVVIIENIHLTDVSTATMIRDLIVKPFDRIRVIITSRTDNIQILENNLLESFFKNPNNLVIDLNQEMDLEQQTQRIGIQCIKIWYPDATLKEIEQLGSYLAKHASHNEVNQAQLLALNEYHKDQLDTTPINFQTFRKMIKNKERRESLLNSFFIKKIQHQITKIEEKTKAPIPEIWRVIYLVFYFGYLEINIRAQLLSDISQTNVDIIRPILGYLEKNGEIRNEMLTYHPIYCGSVLDAIETEDSLRVMTSEYFENLLQGESEEELEAKLVNRISELEPTLRANWYSTDLTSTESNTPVIQDLLPKRITLEKMQELIITATIDDFLQVYYRFEGYSHTFPSYSWMIWETLGTQGIVEKLQEYPIKWGMIQFLDEIHHSKWPKFDDILQQIEIQYFLNWIGTNLGDSPELFQKLRSWNYPKLSMLKIEYLSEIFFGSMEPRYHIIPGEELDQKTFQIFDSLDPEKVMEFLLDQPEERTYKLLLFLQDQSARLKIISRLETAMIEMVLKDQFRSFPNSMIYPILQHINHRIILEKSLNITEFSTIITGWDLNEVHNSLIAHGVKDCYYLLSIISKWKIDPIYSLIDQFKLEEVVCLLDQILNDIKNEEKEKDDQEEENEIEDDDYELEDEFDGEYDRDEDRQEDQYRSTPRESFMNFIILLDRINWKPLPALLEHYGERVFMGIFEEENYEIYESEALYILMKVLWKGREGFKQSFDFYTWFAKDEFDGLKRNLRIIRELEPVLVEKIFHDYFLQEFHSNSFGFGFSFELEWIIKQSEELGFNWQEWIEISKIQAKIQENSHEGFNWIKILQQKGWQVPVALERSRELEESAIWNNLTDLEKASRYYNTPETHQKGVDQFIRIIQNIDLEASYEDFLYLVNYLNRIDPLDQATIINHLPSIFLSNTWEKLLIEEGQTFFGILKDWNYSNLIQVLVEIFLRIHEAQYYSYWKMIYRLKLTQSELELFFDLVWEHQNFEKMTFLPGKILQNILKYKTEIGKLITKKPEQDPFIGLLTQKILTSTQITDEEFVAMITVILEHLSDLKQLISFIEATKRRGSIMQAFTQLPQERQHQLVIHTSIWNLFTLFQILKENKQETRISTIIKILTQEEWQYRFRTEKWDDWISVQFWFSNIYSFDEIYKDGKQRYLSKFR